jgi:hypothetical protein
VKLLQVATGPDVEKRLETFNGEPKHPSLEAPVPFADLLPRDLAAFNLQPFRFCVVDAFASPVDGLYDCMQRKGGTRSYLSVAGLGNAVVARFNRDKRPYRLGGDTLLDLL